MKVLTIGRDKDKKIFEEGSAVRLRAIEYGAKMEELHIVVFVLRKDGFSETQISPNVFIHPTNSSSRWFFVLDAISLGKKLIESKKFEKGLSVLTSQDPFECGFVGWRVAKYANLPHQIQIHTDFLSPYFRHSLFDYVRFLTACFLVPKASALRVVSTAIASSLKDKFPHLRPNIEVLPIFVDIEKIINIAPTRDLKKDFPQFKFIILMASRLTKEKRIAIALKAQRKVLEEFPKTGLVIAGSGPEKNKLEILTKKMGLSNNVVFIGWQDDLISLYKTANLFLLTSEYEGYGMTLVEAGASCCPIVTTSVGLAKTDMFKDGENCFVCPVGDSKCVGEAISTLIHDNSKRELFRHRMQDTVKQISSSKDEYVLKYVAMLEILLPT